MSKGMLKLFHMSGELPRIVHMPAWAPPLTTNNQIIDGVAGKIIVPVWLSLMVWKSTAATPVYDIRGENAVGDNTGKYLLRNWAPSDARYGQPIFFNYGLSFLGVLADEEGIRIYGTLPNSTTVTLSLGYYLVNV